MRGILKAIAFPFIMLWILIIYCIYDVLLDTPASGKDIADAKAWKVFLASFKKGQEEKFSDLYQEELDNLVCGEVWLEYIWRYSLWVKADIAKDRMLLAAKIANILDINARKWHIKIRDEKCRMMDNWVWRSFPTQGSLEDLKKGFTMDIVNNSDNRVLRKIHFSLDEERK